MIKLRRFYSTEQTAEMYAHAYDSTRWHEHVVRIERTRAIAQRLIDTHGLKTCADFSAGDRSLAAGLTGLSALHTADGDIDTDLQLHPSPVDLFICTETIEHLEAPWTVLEKIAKKTKWLVLSTPLDEHPSIGNYEHYWSFTGDDIASILTQSGFAVHTCEVLEQPGWTYSYQVWTAEVV